MLIEVSADYFADANIDFIVNELQSSIVDYFEPKQYSSRQPALFIVIICEPKDHNVRKRYLKKDNTLYFDVILDYNIIKRMNKSQKCKYTSDSIIDSLRYIDEYDFGFKSKSIVEDFIEYFISIKWIE